MAKDNFAAAIKKLAESPTEEVFESAMELIKQVQRMNTYDVTAFWRATEMFTDMSNNEKELLLARRFSSIAWARMSEIVEEYHDKYPFQTTDAPRQIMFILQSARVASRKTVVQKSDFG